MFLNTDPHFMAAHGYKTYAGAHRQMMRVRATDAKDKPLMIIVARHFDRPADDDYVIVCILAKDSLHNPLFYASQKIYVTSAIK